MQLNVGITILMKFIKLFYLLHLNTVTVTCYVVYSIWTMDIDWTYGNGNHFNFQMSDDLYTVFVFVKYSNHDLKSNDF